MINTLCFLLILGFSPSVFYGQTITISGSNTMYPLLKSLSTSFNRENNIEFELSGKGTGTGIQDFLQGKSNIAMLSRKLNSIELEELKLKNINYEILPLALDALCVIAHATIKTESFTFSELEEIYNGKKISWEDFDGENIPIRPIIRDSKSGTADFFKEAIMKNSVISPLCVEFSNTSSIIYAISVSKEYVGYVGCAFVDENLKVISVKTNNEVIEPSEENIKSKKYPLTRELYLLYMKNGSSNALKFIDYCKSITGKKLIESNGFLLINAP